MSCLFSDAPRGVKRYITDGLTSFMDEVCPPKRIVRLADVLGRKVTLMYGSFYVKDLFIR